MQPLRSATDAMRGCDDARAHRVAAAPDRLLQYPANRPGTGGIEHQVVIGIVEKDSIVGHALRRCHDRCRAAAEHDQFLLVRASRTRSWITRSSKQPSAPGSARGR